MSNILTDRCPRCGEAIDYLEHVQHLQCKCGYEFLVAEFVSERRKMEETAAGKAEAEKKLAEISKERSDLQSRLNNTLTALEHIEGTQSASDSKLKEILAGMKTDRQAHDAMAELLRTIKADQADGQDGLTQLLRAVMKEQNTADAKLDAVKQLTGQILAAQEAGGAALRTMRREIEDRIYDLKIKEEKREELYNAFFDWSRSAQAEDVQRLKKLQSSSDVLLQGQQKMTQKLDSLEQGVRDVKDAVEKNADEQRKWRLDAMIELYHQATELQVAREFSKAEDKYRDLLAKGREAKCAEVYWRLLMCHYGVEYQEDQGKLIPIILRPDLAEPEKVGVRKDLELCPKKQHEQAYYNERLEKIDKYLNNYRLLRMREECQYDVFISVKQSDNGHFTTDSDLASDLYDYFKGELGHKHLRVFNSRRCKMELPLGVEFEPYIMTALMSAKLLIVVGSCKEYLDSKWVRSEWQRFQYLQEHDKTKDRRLFCYFVNDMKPEQLPKGLNPNAQALMGGVLAGAAVSKLVDEMFPSDHPAPAPVQGEPVDKLISRMGTWLNLRKYQKVIEKYEELENDRPELLEEAPQICMYTLCAQNECRTLDKLIEKRPDIWREPLFEIAYENANDELKRKLDELKKRSAPPASKPVQPPIPQPAPKPVQPPVPQPAPKPQPAPAGSANAAFQVVLTGCAVDKRLLAIKAVRGLLSCSLKEATDITAGGVHCVAKDVSRAEAERIQRLLADVGASAQIQPSGAELPKPTPKTAPPVFKPTNTPLDTFEKYRVALESEVLQRKRELTMAEIDAFISKYNLGVKQIGRPEVCQDLEEVYVKLGVKKPAAKPSSGPEKKKIVTSQYTYEGELLEGKKHGQGRMLWANGEKYEGSFLNDKMHGTGTYHYKSGNRYEGDWKDNHRTGKGTFFWPNNDKYVGDFVNDQRTGQGTYFYANGEKYVGEFLNGKLHGTGTYYYKSGNRYEGDWKDDHRTGKGTFFWPNNEKYIGDFLNDKMHGTGTYYYKSGNRYEGDWKDDHRTGKGTFLWSNNEKYIGDFLNDKLHGTGTYYYKSGNRYEGDWKDDHRTGKGTFFWPNNDKYVGDFVNDQRTGQGTYFYANGDKYVGDFLEGKFTGKGTYYKASGEAIPYKDGKAAPVPPLKDRKGYLEALEAYVQTQKNTRLTADQVDTFWKFRRLHEPNLTREMVDSDLEELYRKLGIPKAQPKPQGTPLDTFRKYEIALEGEVGRHKRELTMAEIDAFISKYNLDVKHVGRTEVCKDLEDIYRRLGIKRTAAKSAEPAQTTSKSSACVSQKKELTDAAVTEFWREWLPKVNASAVMKPQLTSAEEEAARKAVGIWIAATVNVLGTIHVNHGLFKGHTAIVITKDRLYINVNNRTACPPIEIQFRHLRGAEVTSVAGGKNRLILNTVNGTKEFFSPASQERDALKFGALADAINQFIKTFKL